jgi:hypothetical protein
MSIPLHLWTAERLLVGISTAVGEGLRRDLRDLLGEGPSLDALLDLLTADGLANTVPFVLAAAEPAGVRLIIRGDLRITATAADGTAEEHDAGRSATWHDDVLTDVVDLGIATGDQGSTFVWLVPAPTPEPVIDLTDDDAPEAATPGSAGSDGVTPEGADGADDAVAAVDGAVVAADDAPADAPDGPGADVSGGHDVDVHPDEPVDPSPASDAAAPDYSGLLGDTVYDHAEEAPLPTPIDRNDATFDDPDDDPGPGTGVDPRPVPDLEVDPASDLVATEAVVDDAGPEADGTGMVGRTIYDRVGADGATAGDPEAETTQPYETPKAGPGEVQAVHCPAGHPNPPASDACRGCGAAIVDQRVSVIRRPVIARLVFERGPVIDVDRTQIIGRGPTTPTGVVEEPNLVTVPNPDGDLSREHTAVRLEGWDLVIEDLGSTNGTEVHLPGREPQRLHDHDPILVVPGTQVTLAGAVRFLIESPGGPGPSHGS